MSGSKKMVNISRLKSYVSIKLFKRTLAGSDMIQTHRDPQNLQILWSYMSFFEYFFMYLREFTVIICFFRNYVNALYYAILLNLQIKKKYHDFAYSQQRFILTLRTSI